MPRFKKEKKEKKKEEEKKEEENEENEEKVELAIANASNEYDLIQAFERMFDLLWNHMVEFGWVEAMESADDDDWVQTRYMEPNLSFSNRIAGVNYFDSLSCACWSYIDKIESGSVDEEEARIAWEILWDAFEVDYRNSTNLEDDSVRNESLA